MATSGSPASLKAALAARTNSAGEPLKGYKANVAHIRRAIAQLEMAQRILAEASPEAAK